MYWYCQAHNDAALILAPEMLFKPDASFLSDVLVLSGAERRYTHSYPGDFTSNVQLDEKLLCQSHHL